MNSLKIYSLYHVGLNNCLVTKDNNNKQRAVQTQLNTVGSGRFTGEIILDLDLEVVSYT